MLRKLFAFCFLVLGNGECHLIVPLHLFISYLKGDERSEVFTLWDNDGDGILSFVQMADAMRCLNQNPTEKELEIIVAEYDPEGTDQYSFESFCSILDKHSKQMDAVTVIREALKVFDTDANGLVSIPELRNVMTNLGEKQPQQDVDQLLLQFETDEDGKINYEEIVTLLAQ